MLNRMVEGAGYIERGRGGERDHEFGGYNIVNIRGVGGSCWLMREVHDFS